MKRSLQTGRLTITGAFFGSLGFVAEPIGPFLGLDAGDAIELGELLAFLSDWLASDPDRLDSSLGEFVGVPDYIGPVATIDELRADVDRFARILLGYSRATSDEPPLPS